MENLVAYRLSARGGPLVFHLGERGVGLEESSTVLHSDTLFSALCLAWKSLGRDLSQVFQAFPRAGGEQGAEQAGGIVPPFLLSSAFPYCGPTYFFPRPLLRLLGVADEPAVGKTLKKVRFVSKTLFEKLIHGEPVGEFLLQDGPSGKTLHRDLLLQASKVWLTAEEAGALPKNRVMWSEGTQPRVTIGRVGGRSTPFGVGRVHFAENCGLYFLVQYNDPAWKKEVEDALELLAGEGVGGERSVGNGQFRLEVDGPFSIAEPAGPDGYTSLSLVWPEKSAVQAGLLESAQYGLIPRRGWITSSGGPALRRPNVRMLAEGSVFHRVPAGSLVDLTPLGSDGKWMLDHRVWRYGLGFPVGWRAPKE